MDLNFSFLYFNLPTFALHAVAAGLAYFAVKDSDTKQQIAVIVALLLWGVTITGS